MQSVPCPHPALAPALACLHPTLCCAAATYEFVIQDALLGPSAKVTYRTFICLYDDADNDMFAFVSTSITVVSECVSAGMPACSLRLQSVHLRHSLQLRPTELAWGSEGHQPASQRHKLTT